MYSFKPLKRGIWELKNLAEKQENAGAQQKNSQLNSLDKINDRLSDAVIHEDSVSVA